MSETAFIIATYQSESFIRQALDSILLHEPSSCIIIVDNGSNDNTIKILSQYENIIVLPQNKNLGFGKANNIGIKKALEIGCKYIYLLNHDAFLIEPVIQTLKSILSENPKIGVISPFQLQSNMLNLEPNFERFMYQSGVLNQYFADTQKRELPQVYNPVFVQAASWFLPANVVKIVGGFDPIFFHYGEDNNFLNRLKYHGFTIAVAPSLKICHYTNPTKVGYKTDYGPYHLLRLKALHLVDYTDINKPFNSKKYFVDLILNLSSILKSVLTLQFKRVPGQIKHFCMMIEYYKSILLARKITKKGKGCYL